MQASVTCIVQGTCYLIQKPSLIVTSTHVTSGCTNIGSGQDDVGEGAVATYQTVACRLDTNPDDVVALNPASPEVRPQFIEVGSREKAVAYGVIV